MSYHPRLLALKQDKAAPGQGAPHLPERGFLRSVTGTLEAAPDEKLLGAVTEGSHAAFSELVNRHSLRFYHLAYRYLGAREQAEDIVQDAFLKVWENPHHWSPDHGTAFTTWFTRVITNLCLDVKRKKQHAPLPDDLAIPASQEETVQASEEEKGLAQELGRLPERQRMAVLLCFEKGVSNKEAAQAMGLQCKALQSLLMRAKKTLRIRLRHLL